MHLYIVDKYQGEIKECDEGELKFVDIDLLDTLPMWEGDKIFLEYLNKDETYFELELRYSGDKLISSKKLK